jgi:DinB superfamily
MHSLNVFSQIRQLIRTAVEDLDDGAMFTIPDGFDNNVAWNLGHIIVTQQALHYRLSGLPTVTTREDIAMFKTGSSPADWAREPDMNRLRALLDETADRLEPDCEAGLFANFRPYTTSTGVDLGNFEEALAFNNFHEGLHLGAILALRNLVDGT